MMSRFRNNQNHFSKIYISLGRKVDEIYGNVFARFSNDFKDKSLVYKGYSVVRFQEKLYMVKLII